MVKVVVLAGGGGVRLWPLSKEEFPKQFLHFGDGESLLQKAVKRMREFPLCDQVILSTNAAYAPLVEAQVGKDCAILVEPERKNTAGAIALAVKYLEELGAEKEEPILIFPSDHLISPVEKLYFYLERGISAVKAGRVVLFGIRPYRPETGYGYVEKGEELEEGIYEVEQFCEKPPLEEAERYLRSSHFFWNAGIFGFTPRIFWDEWKGHGMTSFDPEEESFAYFLQQFPHLPNVSIDYALMEKSENLAICPMELNWSDVGSWDTVYEVMEKDAERNVIVGNVVSLETSDSLILGGKRIISTIGLKDLLIVETDEAIFIAKRGESQKVRQLMKEMALQKEEERLVKGGAGSEM